GVLDLLRRHFLGGKHVVQLVIGDEAARLSRLDQLLDGCVGHVEHRTIGGLSLRLLMVLGFSGFCGHSFTPKRKMSLSQAWLASAAELPSVRCSRNAQTHGSD